MCGEWNRRSTVSPSPKASWLCTAVTAFKILWDLMKQVRDNQMANLAGNLQGWPVQTLVLGEKARFRDGVVAHPLSQRKPTASDTSGLPLLRSHYRTRGPYTFNAGHAADGAASWKLPGSLALQPSPAQPSAKTHSWIHPQPF